MTKSKSKYKGNDKEEEQKYDKILRDNVVSFILMAAAEVLDLPVLNLRPIESTLIGNIKREVDHLSEFTAPNNVESILHMEFQSSDDPAMIKRMQLYHALITFKHEKPVYQYCIYLGATPTKMGNDIKQIVPNARNPYKFNMIELRNLPYQQFLGSNIPEVIVLSILANPQDKPAQEVLEMTLKRLSACCSDKDALEKYVGQILKLSKLRNLQVEAEQIINTMPIHYDVATDILFLKGEKAGIEKGVAAEREKNLINLLQSGRLTDAEVANIIQVPIATVLEVKNRLGLQ